MRAPGGAQDASRGGADSLGLGKEWARRGRIWGAALLAAFAGEIGCGDFDDFDDRDEAVVEIEFFAGLAFHEDFHGSDLFGGIPDEFGGAMADDAGVAVAVLAGDAALDQLVLTVEFKADIRVLGQKVEFFAFHAAVHVENKLSVLPCIAVVHREDVNALAVAHPQADDVCGVKDMAHFALIRDLAISSSHFNDSLLF